MTQSTQIVATLKRALKSQGRTYADVARIFELTEASVKRLFADENFTLRRLEQVCQLLQLDFADLVRMMPGAGPPVRELTDAQEHEIATDVNLLLVAVSVLNRWTGDDIASHYDLSEPELMRYLTRLDRLKLIELLPRNRIRLCVAANFRWRTDGPIQRFFQARVAAEFFNSRFAEPTERLLVCNGMLADTANAVMQRRMERLAQDFAEVNSEDAQQPLANRYGTTLVVALRRWEYPPFAARRSARPGAALARARPRRTSDSG